MINIITSLFLSLAISASAPTNGTYINLEEVQTIEVTGTGALFTFNDGTGYYYEF